MKTNLRHLFGASILGLTLAAAPQAGVAQTVSETTVQSTPVMSAGTVTEFGPGVITVRTETSPEPMRYTYSKTTTYVDETGAPVSVETVKSGLPVTVYYVKQGNQLVASKVVVRKTTTTTAPASPVIEEKKSSTTTTTTTGD